MAPLTPCVEKIYTVKPVLAIFDSLKSRPTYTVANLRKPLAPWKFKWKCTFHSAETGGRVEKPFQWMGIWSTLISCHREIPVCCPYLWKKDGGWLGIRNDDFGPRTVVTKLYSQIGSLNLHIKRSAKPETLTKIEDKQVARLWSNYRVQYHGRMSVPWKCGQLWEVFTVQALPTLQGLL